MQKNLLKFVLDSLLFVAMTATAAIGLLLGFVIPKGGQLPYQEKVFLGLHRHSWGDIHLFFAITFLIILPFHLWLNWSWISSSTKKYFGEKWKKYLLVLCGAWVILLIVAYITEH